MTCNHQRERGSIYIIVLGATMIVSTLGITALLANRLRHRALGNSSDVVQARYFAQSGIDRALLAIRQDPNWRQTYTNGDWFTHVAIGGGRFTVSGIDPNDGNLSDSSSDDVVLTAKGFQGRAQHQIAVELHAQTTGLSCLNGALVADNDVEFKNNSRLTCNQTVFANHSVSASNATVDSNVEAYNGVVGSTYNGNHASGIPSRQMPGPSIFNYYLANGTHINVNLLPTTGPGDPKLANIVLSPNSNPYGPTTNPQGIYIINCKGGKLRIKECRIVGTLVVVNTGSEITIDDTIHWVPALPNFPALLVEGKLKMELDLGHLVEAPGENFNPPGTPYLDVEDIDVDDSYPSMISGIIYASGDVEFRKDGNTIRGVVVGGSTIKFMDFTTVNLTYDANIKANPPPGFAGPLIMKIAAGSWRQIVQ